jgi:hypothetical protein
MLIESTRIRNLLNATTASSQLSYTDEPRALEEPNSYRFPMNPIPALVILLLGLMMSSHHQESMVSTMIHSQWGTLLVGAAFARAATYILFYLSPPTSIFPGRPPTELITAFCLMAGGMIFMASVSLHHPIHISVLLTDVRLATASKQWRPMAWTLCLSSRSRWA